MKKIIKKYKSMPLPLKAGIWFTICNILQKGISLISLPIFTRILSTQEYGIYSIYLSWLNILSIFTCLNLYYGVFNKAMIKFQNDRERYVSSMQGLITILVLSWFIIYMVFRQWLNKFFSMSTPIMIIMTLEMFCIPIIQFWNGKKRFEYRYQEVVSLSFLQSILNPLLGVLIVVFYTPTAQGRIIGTLIVELFFCLIIMMRQYKRNSSFYVYEYWNYALKFNIPLIPHYLSGIVLSQGDRIIIEYLDTETSVALYSVSYNIAMLSQLFTNAITQSLTPWMYKCIEESRYEEINKRLRPLMILVASLCFLLMLFAPECVYILASKKYMEAIYIIPPIAASVFFIYIYNIYSNFEFYFEKRVFITIGSTIAAVTNVILNFIFIPTYGYIAAAYTTLFCYLLYAYSHYFFSLKICKEYLQSTKIFSLFDLLVVSGLILLMVFLSNLLYYYGIIRYILITLIVIIILLYRKRILNVIQG